MIIKRLNLFILCVLLVIAHLITLSEVDRQSNLLNMKSENFYVLPSPLLKIMTFEFHGLTADYLFLKSLTFYGSTMERKEQPRIKDREWVWMYDVLNTATDLDPYFIDPYYFANASFTWGTGMVKETNDLLAKGSRYRDWDWMLPYFMGFNEFYFLKDNARASEYLMEGAKRPDAPLILTTLATRLEYESDRTKIAVDFLNETIEKTKDKTVREDLKNRLVSLNGILILEKAVEIYRSKYHKIPHDVKELQTSHILIQTPIDPFGGEYYIDSHGEVKITSDLRMMAKRKN